MAVNLLGKQSADTLGNVSVRRPLPFVYIKPSELVDVDENNQSFIIRFDNPDAATKSDYETFYPSDQWQIKLQNTQTSTITDVSGDLATVISADTIDGISGSASALTTGYYECSIVRNVGGDQPIEITLLSTNDTPPVVLRKPPSVNLTDDTRINRILTDSFSPIFIPVDNPGSAAVSTEYDRIYGTEYKIRLQDQNNSSTRIDIPAELNSNNISNEILGFRSTIQGFPAELQTVSMWTCVSVIASASHYNFSDTEFITESGTRLPQIIIQPQPVYIKPRTPFEVNKPDTLVDVLFDNPDGATITDYNLVYPDTDWQITFKNIDSSLTPPQVISISGSLSASSNALDKITGDASQLSVGYYECDLVGNAGGVVTTLIRLDTGFINPPLYLIKPPTVSLVDSITIDVPLNGDITIPVSNPSGAKSSDYIKVYQSGGYKIHLENNNDSTTQEVNAILETNNNTEQIIVAFRSASPSTITPGTQWTCTKVTSTDPFSLSDTNEFVIESGTPPIVNFLAN